MTDKEQVIGALRATLLSVKGAITLKQCNRDYRELQGEWIPFRKLGYSSLEKIFLDVPGFKVTQVNGEWLVDAIATQESQHLAAMVSRQRSSKKFTPRLSYSNRFPKKQGSMRKPASTNYAPSYNDHYSNKYYRVKAGPALNNNSYNRCNYTYPKTNDTNRVPLNTKSTSKPLAENQEKYASNVTVKTTNNSHEPTTNNTSDTKRDVKNTSNDIIKHSSTRNESKSDVKQSVKITASQRLSNLRDRLTIDLIPLHMPAATVECVENTDPLPVTESLGCLPNLEPPPDTTAVAKLEWTCRKFNLSPPVYKFQSIPTKRGAAPDIHCSIKVDKQHSDAASTQGKRIDTQYSVTSYPFGSPTQEMAKELASAKMLAMIESAEAADVPIASSSTAITRLADLVAEHEAGLWETTVPHLYREKYGENLPSNWPELLENCPRIIKDRVANELFVLLPNNYKPSSPIITESFSDESIDGDLPPLQFPTEDYWNVFITAANSTLEIWLRIIGPQYSDAFETLLMDMSNYYNMNGTNVDKSMILLDAWYAVNLEDGGWQRAKILEVEDDTAIVFLGDHGDDDIVSFDKIKILEPQFRKLPAQAVLCRLEGAEELAVNAHTSTMVRQRLPGQVLVAAPGPRHDPADPSVAVVLYDTSTPRDLNLNKEFVQDFCIAGAFTLTQKLCEVEVGCVTEEGCVWVSRAGSGASVSAALSLLTAGPYRRPLPPAPQAPTPAPNALYIVRTLHGDWVRCTIISGLDGEGTVRTQLVDSGLVLRAPLSSLVPLSTFSPALNAYPSQAIQVRLGPAERAVTNMVARLRELLVGACVLCRALPAPTPAAVSPPHVVLFVRSGPQNILASVNDAILMEYDLLQQGKTKEEEEEESTNHVEALHRKKERIFRSMSAASGVTSAAGSVAGASVTGGDEAAKHSSPLPPPMLPASEQCFDVYISMAANPWNFVVQPNSTRNDLQSMMLMLQTECPKLAASKAPHNPVSGELYTALYDKDSTWYRIIVAGTVSSETVSVYFCDYGDLALVETQALRPVPADVPLARTLPPQAIKARLYNVVPVNQDWEVEDCIRFQELCVDQLFVGICKNVGKDPLNPTEPLLTLDLIDTSTDEDVFLNQQLVNEKRARHA